MGKNIRVIIGTALCGLSTLLSAIACGIYGWAWSETDLVETTFSLWRVCVAIATDEVCSEIKYPSSELTVTRTLVITGVIHAGVATLFALLFMMKTPMTGKSCSKPLPTGCLISSMIGVVLLVSAVAVYGSSYEDDYGDNFSLGQAFYVCCVSAFCLLAGGINVFRSDNRADEDGRVNPTTTTTTSTAMHTYPGHPQEPAVLLYGTHLPTYPGTGAPLYPAYGHPGGPAGYPPAYPTVSSQNMYNGQQYNNPAFSTPPAQMQY